MEWKKKIILKLVSFLGKIQRSRVILTLYVPRIVTSSINKPTRCTFCMYLFYSLFEKLRVSNDHFDHHNEFINLLYLQRCTNDANVSNCLVL